MLLTVKLRLTRPFLGELKPDGRGIRRFKRVNDNIHINTMFWQNQLQLAANQLCCTVNAKTILPPRSIVPASIHEYTRRYSKMGVDRFESFRTGTVLTMDFIVREDLPKAPSPEQFKLMLMFVGEYLGLSQFGSQFNYGMFTLDSVELKQYGIKESGSVSGDGMPQVRKPGAVQDGGNHNDPGV